MAGQIRNVVRVLVRRLLVELALHFKHSLKLWFGVLTSKLFHNIQLNNLYWHITSARERHTACFFISIRCLSSWADRGGRWCEIKKAKPLGFCLIYLNRRIWLRYWENSLKYFILTQSHDINSNFCFFFSLGFGKKRSRLVICLIVPDCLVLGKNRNIFFIKFTLIWSQEILLRENCFYGQNALQNRLGWLLQFLTILFVAFNRNRNFCVFFHWWDVCLDLLSVVLSSCTIRNYNKRVRNYLTFPNLQIDAGGGRGAPWDSSDFIMQRLSSFGPFLVICSYSDIFWSLIIYM